MLTRYKHVVIEDFQGPPDVHEVQAIEQELGVALPSSFRQFLDVANGGTLEYSVRVPPTPDGEEMLFGMLFQAGRDRSDEYGYGTLIGEARDHRRFIGIPKEVLPFAQDGGGSTVYLDLTESGRGRVVAYVIGLPAWTGLRQEDALVEVARDFDEYLSRLYLEDDFLEETFHLLGKAISDGDEEGVRASREYLDLAVPDWRERHPNLA
jgi:cell wall assembly regulator SMI1